MCKIGLLLSAVLIAFVLPTYALAEEASDAKDPGIDVSKFEHQEGFFDFYWDEDAGKIWLEIDDVEQPFLYVTSLATGLGSNPVGLDRGQLGETRIVRFRRVGKRVFLIQENLNYRATTDNAAERRAIQESFAESILWSGELKRSTASESAEASEIVDLSDLLVRDAHDCVGTLESAGQGTFSLDKNRSYIHLPRTKAFPKNTEFEVALTFASSKPGSLARRASADGKSITLRQHHSFVQLPESGFRPRRFDPRVGCFAVTFADYSVPIDQPIEQKLITRHRLEKANPGESPSPAKQPIVYYVDPGVPQPVRDALIEGASWWAAAFEAAGYSDAFRVQVLPEDADPMDVRYNMIQWVHRATRGWSYGQSVVDPRTGEIIKGHVLLGSLRVRQDHLLFEGLTGVPQTLQMRAGACGLGMLPDESYLSQLDPNASSVSVALARIRQLSAHEVGHTLGFAHNFAASTYGDRASVMDYPAPRTKIVDGKIDLSDAYGVGVGPWDKFTVKYAYSEFTAEEEASQLEKLVEQAIADKMRYVTDADARPAGAAHPWGNLWDNGQEPIAALKHELAVRRLAIDGFGAHVLLDGQPLSDLEIALAPVYLHHRYQVDATAKMLGGYDYSYALPGDGQTPQQPIDVQLQKAALEVLLQTLSPNELIVPERIVSLIPPKTASSPNDRERFESQTGPIFDPASAMRAAAELTIGNLLQPQRATRLARMEDESWGLTQVIHQLFQQCLLNEPPASGDALEARRIVQSTAVQKLFELADSQAASDDARAIAIAQLRNFQSYTKLLTGQATTEIQRAHFAQLEQEIERFLTRNGPAVKPRRPSELPPGSPIGNP